MKKYSWKWFKEFLGNSKPKTLDKKIEEYAKEVQKPYKSAKLIGDNAIFVLQSGVVLEKLVCTPSEWGSLLCCRSESEMISLVNIYTRKLDPKDKVETVQLDWGVLKEVDDFKVTDGIVKIKGIDRSLPLMMVNKFTEIVVRRKSSYLNPYPTFLNDDEEYIALKNFWYWLCLNPFPEVVKNLYDFLKKGDFKITKDGMFLAYRRVRKVDNSMDTSLVEFISNSYVKIKGWKKSPKNFEVFDDGGLVLQKVGENKGTNGFKGNLADLYQNIHQMEENRYTDNHTRSFDIRIGKVVSIPRSECTHSNADCGTGGLMCSPSI